MAWLDDNGLSRDLGEDTRYFTEALWYYNDDATSSVVSVDIYSQVVPSYPELRSGVGDFRFYYTKSETSSSV